MTAAGRQPSARFQRTRVLVVDDHALFRRGLRIALSQEQDIEVVAACADTPTAVELVRQLAPDVVLVDLATPFEGGLAACAAITAAAPGTRVLLLAPSGGQPDTESAQAAGACGFLVKDASAGEVAGAIRTAADGVQPAGDGLQSGSGSDGWQSAADGRGVTADGLPPDADGWQPAAEDD